jgi:hypothetical protein
VKIIICFVILSQFLSAAEYDHAKIVNQYKYISVSKAILNWKISKANLKKISDKDFKKMTSEKEKTQYLVHLAQQKKFIGEKRSVVVEALGDPTSYFFSEQNATYSLLKIDTDQWVVSFQVSSDQIVRSIKIAKQCCYEVK